MDADVPASGLRFNSEGRHQPGLAVPRPSKWQPERRPAPDPWRGHADVAQLDRARVHEPEHAGSIPAVRYFSSLDGARKRMLFGCGDGLPHDRLVWSINIVRMEEGGPGHGRWGADPSAEGWGTLPSCDRAGKGPRGNQVFGPGVPALVVRGQMRTCDHEGTRLPGERRGTRQTARTAGGEARTAEGEDVRPCGNTKDCSIRPSDRMRMIC